MYYFDGAGVQIAHGEVHDAADAALVDQLLCAEHPRHVAVIEGHAGS